MMAALKHSGRAAGRLLKDASAELQVNRAVVMAAVKQNGWALGYASAELQADRAVVMVAVQQIGGALQFASAELQADMAVVMVAVQQHGWALQFASGGIRPIVSNRLQRWQNAQAPNPAVATEAPNPLQVVFNHTLQAIPRAQVGTLLSAALEDEINAVARRTWADFDLADDLKVDDEQAHLFDYLFYLMDENGAVVSFRSAVWEQDEKAWLFENGVVRDHGNALGSIMLQMILRYFLTRPDHAARRSFVANVKKANHANKRLYKNFKCRSEGFEGEGFVESKPTKKLRRSRAFVAFKFNQSE